MNVARRYSLSRVFENDQKEKKEVLFENSS